MGASGSKQGYCIEKVLEGSPAKSAGLEVEDDSIIAVNGAPVPSDPKVMTQILISNAGKVVKLQVYNKHTKAVRVVTLTLMTGSDPLGAELEFETSEGHGHSHDGHGHSHGGHGHSH